MKGKRDMSGRGSGLARGRALIMVLLCVGCSPSDPGTVSADRLALSTPREEPRPTRALTSLEENDRLVNLVKDAEREDDRVRYEEWLDALMAQEQGRIMFREWNVWNRGESRHDVRFVYTVMLDDYSVVRKGYSWQVNAMLDVVDPPRELSLTEVGSARSSKEKEERKRPVHLQDESFSLE